MNRFDKIEFEKIIILRICDYIEWESAVIKMPTNIRQTQELNQDSNALTVLKFITTNSSNPNTINSNNNFHNSVPSKHTLMHNQEFKLIKQLITIRYMESLSIIKHNHLLTIKINNLFIIKTKLLTSHINTKLIQTRCSKKYIQIIIFRTFEIRWQKQQN